MAQEGASGGHFGNVKVFVTPPEFVWNLLFKDSLGTVYPRKFINNDSYSDRDMAFGQYDDVLYYFKDSKLLPLGTQQDSLVEAIST